MFTVGIFCVVDFMYRDVMLPYLRWLEDVYDDLRKMEVKAWGGKMKNREEWRISGGQSSP
jgi:hypothetical protein